MRTLYTPPGNSGGTGKAGEKGSNNRTPRTESPNQKSLVEKGKDLFTDLTNRGYDTDPDRIRQSGLGSGFNRSFIDNIVDRTKGPSTTGYRKLLREGQGGPYDLSGLSDAQLNEFLSDYSGEYEMEEKRKPREEADPWTGINRYRGNVAARNRKRTGFDPRRNSVGAQLNNPYNLGRR